MEDLTLHDYLAILKRRKKSFLLAFTGLLSLSILFAMHWSNYRSTATVEIEQPEVSVNMTTPTGMNPNEMLEALADQRISRIEQKVTSTSSLIEIVTKFNLYSSGKKMTPLVDLADAMSKKIKIGLVSSTINAAAAGKETPEQLAAIAFTLSFDYSDPLVAQQVTDELVTRFLDEDLKERRAEAKETSDFLATQITALETSMADQEKKIATYHAAHAESRPEALMFNQQAAESTAFNLQSLESQITTNEGTQGSLRAQLATIDPYSRVLADGQVLTTPAVELKALEAKYTTLTAQYGPDHPDVVKTRHQIEALRAQVGIKKGDDTAQLKAQIADIRTNLETAEKTNGPDNPDTVSLRHQLEKLEADLTARKGSEAPQDELKEDADNPAYLELAAQLKSAEEQNKSLIAERQSLQDQQAKYQQALAETPASEQEMAALSRDYENAQLRYRDLKDKKMAADMDVQMVQDRVAQRLVVINPPKLPGRTQPSRFLLILGGFVLAMAGGLGSVVVTEAMGQSIHGMLHLSSLVGEAPLVSIPYVFTAEERNRIARLRRQVFRGGFALAVLGLLVVSQMVMPLDVLWGVIAHHLGLS